MSPFGFTPDENSDENSGNQPQDFAAMMRQMQEQIQKQFKEMGLNPAGFINPLAAFTQAVQGKGEALPQALVRDTAKKFIQA